MAYRKIVGIILVALILAFAYYAISPLFRNVEVNDEAPVGLESLPDEQTREIESGFEKLSPEDQKKMTEEMDEANSKSPVIMGDMDPEKVAATPKDMLFPIMGTGGHPASGSVRVIETAEGTVLRFENFKTINGPNLHLYLAKDTSATEFIDLGKIKGTSGNINYTVPEGVDISDYPYVMHWCVPFSVLFNYAEIN